MIEHADMVQGSDSWYRARLGIPTSSQAHRIVTPAKLKPSDSSNKYLCEKLSERLLGVSDETALSGFMARGSALEKSAVSWFGLVTGLKTRASGFCTTDDGLSGCSVDRLVLGDDGQPAGVLEIKCPGAAKHLMAVLEYEEADHRIQVQDQLRITGLAFAFRLSYHDDLPKALKHYDRDEEVIGALTIHVGAFCDRLAEAEKLLRAKMGERVAA